ncbi:hypothetical protein CA983_01840 [Streptomyces swartbergensis]|uniref:Short-chain dehydrogenase n=1 Tax=Streptomyces swartbergensis TaxID=487165 RepID=A0A243SAZ6_9ACTN|nr:hypothetical protein CA983_01840 [Streptomyces swartbergensis]
MDLAPRIRVNAVSPGAIASHGMAAVTGNPEVKAAMENAIPLRCLGDPEHIAAR